MLFKLYICNSPLPTLYLQRCRCVSYRFVSPYSSLQQMNGPARGRGRHITEMLPIPESPSESDARLTYRCKQAGPWQLRLSTYPH